MNAGLQFANEGLKKKKEEEGGKKKKKKNALTLSSQAPFNPCSYQIHLDLVPSMQAELTFTGLRDCLLQSRPPASVPLLTRPPASENRPGPRGNLRARRRDRSDRVELGPTIV